MRKYLSLPTFKILIGADSISVNPSFTDNNGDDSSYIFRGKWRIVGGQAQAKRERTSCTPAITTRILMTAIGIAVSHASWAQSSVAVYGMLDIGVSYFTNVDGRSHTGVQSGVALPSIIGLRGNEELSGGRSAIFALESLISLSNGRAQPGSLFGYSAWVGLEDRDLGTIKFGRQSDFMSDSLTLKNLVPAIVNGGLYNSPAGPTQFAGLNMATYGPDGGHWDWDRTGVESVNNSIKYTSPKWKGVTVGAMYGFSNNEQGSGNTISFGLNYESGNLGLGAAYTGLRKHTGADGNDAAFHIWGAGIRYQMGELLAIANFTTTRNTVNDAAVYQTSIGGSYNLGRGVSIGASYSYLKGNDQLQKKHAHQISSTLNYDLSKRTAVYFGWTYQRASSGANALINGGYSDGDNPNVSAFASSNRNQGILRVGIRTFF